MRTTMLVILAILIGSVLGILAIKPFVAAGKNSPAPQTTLEQPEPK